MIFRKTYTSIYGPADEIEINTLEELLALMKEENEPIIIFNDSDNDHPDYRIEVYDDYRE